MKKIFKTFIIVGLVASATSCKKYLDVNTNPNDITAATPELILPQALTTTAAINNTLNGAAYGGDVGGFMSNAGGVSGFGNFWTFNFNSGDAPAFASYYSNLRDYQYILDNTTATGAYKNFNAIARLMKSYDFMKLVDIYGDVPYSQALQGASNLSPVYDKGEDVYKACITEIDNALTQFRAANAASTISVASNSNGKIDVTVYSTVSLATGSGNTNNPMSYSSSVVGNGTDMSIWIKFANTLKLRALLKIRNVASLSAFYATEKASLENNFTTADVLINPGYVQQPNKQNPLWNSYAWTYTGTNSTASYLPTAFAMAFYDGNKLVDGKRTGVTPNIVYTDKGRGNLIYRDYVKKNQLGFQSTNTALQPSNPTGGNWYVGTSGNGQPTNLAALGYGIMKGPDQGQPILTAAESYLLQAEATLVNLISGTAASVLFDNGVQSSYAYLDKDHTDVQSSTIGVPATQYAEYRANNPTSLLVHYELCTTDDQRLEAIITQKYIAMNMLTNDEAWNDYRRTYNATLKTGYPRSVPPSQTANAADPILSFSPNFSTIGTTRADGLTGRMLYPSSEYSYNTANVPVVDVNTTLVFWDARPKN